jgi:hypothetical protein
VETASLSLLLSGTVRCWLSLLTRICLAWHLQQRIDAGVALWCDHGFHLGVHCNNRILFLWRLYASHYPWVGQSNAGCFSESRAYHLTSSTANWAGVALWCDHGFHHGACCSNIILFSWRLYASHHPWVKQLDAGCSSESHVSHVTSSTANWPRSSIIVWQWVSWKCVLQQHTLIFVKTVRLLLSLSGTIECGLLFRFECLSRVIFHS